LAYTYIQALRTKVHGNGTKVQKFTSELFLFCFSDRFVSQEIILFQLVYTIYNDTFSLGSEKLL
jgi:hypothetical protein